MARLSIMLLYLALAIPCVAVCGPTLTPWFLAVLSVAFVWCYVAVVDGSTVVSVTVVFIITLVFPIAVLSAVAWPDYHSWSAIGSLWLAASKHAPLWGLDILFPVAAATFTALFMSHKRANTAFKRDALKRAP